MARKSTAEIHAEVHARAMKRFDRCYSSQREVRDQCTQDRRFVYVPGATWEGTWGEQYANRPRFEVNKCHHAVQRILGDYKNNRISPKFRAASNASAKDAEILDGMYRADEQRSNAMEAYDNAFDEAVSGGYGAFRYVTRYEDEDDEESKLVIDIEPIFDADQSVWFDIDAKRQDKKDATYCFVISCYERQNYIDEHGEVTTFDTTDRMTMFDWFSPDVIYVAEYYEIEKKTEKCLYYTLSDEAGNVLDEVKIVEEKDDEDQAKEIAELEAQGFIFAREESKKTKVVHKYIIDGARVIEDAGIIAGKNIPIVPVFGKRGFVSNVERMQGHVRLTTDVMRIYNMLVSMLAEIAIVSPVEKPIFTPEEIKGHEGPWSTDNINKYPYLTRNTVLDVAGNPMPMPVQYTKAPQIPQAIVGLMELCNMDMKELLGSQENGEKMIANVSAKAVELVQNQLDRQTYIYTDSMAKAMRRGGEIWLDIKREITDDDPEEEHLVIREGGDESKVKLNQPVMKSGVMSYENNIHEGRFDVIADVGPNYMTKRDTAVQRLLSVLQYFQNPQEQSVIASSMLTLMDADSIGDLQKWARRNLLAAGAATPTEEEAQEMAQARANQKPDPNEVYLLEEAKKSAALAGKAQADTQKSIAETEKTRAETAEVINEIGLAKMDRLISLMEADAQARQSKEKPV